MKRLLSVLAIVFSLGIATASMDAEAAKRMGSGKSMGTQRQAVQDKAPTAPTAQSASPAAGAGAGAAAASKPSWAGPIAGLAAGLGIAALASHFGFGDELASMVMMGLLAFAVMAVIGFIMRKRAQTGQRAGMQAPGGLTPATVGAGTGSSDNSQAGQQTAAYKVSMPAGTSSAASGSIIGSGIAAASPEPAIPADFDQAAFERNAKANFIRLQAAYDAGNMDDIREFTSPEMYAELKLEFAEREPGVQQGDVLRLDAKVLEVADEGHRYLVSVQFTGFIRYGEGTADETFDEVWHLTKLRQGGSGWVVAGIQQLS